VRDFYYQFKDELSLALRTPESSLCTEIIEANLHRPGLALAGFTGVYSYQRVQIVGTTEWSYLESVGADKRKEIFARLQDYRSPLWVLTHNAGLHEELMQMCLSQNVPIITTSRETLDFCTEVQDILEDWFAPYCSVHASLVDVYGVGMLYVGESGVGKSECVLDLVERGHRLVADDIVHLIRKGHSIIGKGNKILGHHMEIRGIGIVEMETVSDVPVALLVELTSEIERLPVDKRERAILGVSLPLSSIDAMSASAPSKVALALDRMGLKF